MENWYIRDNTHRDVSGKMHRNKEMSSLILRCGQYATSQYTGLYGCHRRLIHIFLVLLKAGFHVRSELNVKDP